MPLYKAEIKVTNSGKSFWTTVTAGHQGQVAEIIRSQWSNVIYIRNITEVSERNDRSSGVSDSLDVEGIWLLGLIFVVGYLIFVYWYIAVPIIIVIWLLWLWARD
jgi:hypothetical protein